MKKGHDKYCTQIKWLNYLINVPSGVANCRNLPFSGRARWDSRVRLPKKKMHESRHQHLFEKKVRKIKKESTNFKNKGSRVVYAREGIGTPRVYHKGRQPLIECAKSWLQYLFIFPFFMFLLLGVNKSVSLAPTYPQVWWGTQIYVVL